MRFNIQALLLLLLAPCMPACQTLRLNQERANIPTSQLPRIVIPKHYDLALTVLPDQERFQGRVAIHVETQKPTSIIWLHGWELNVTRASLSLADGCTVKVRYKQLNDDGVAKVELPEEVKSQRARLKFDYDAWFMATDLEGLYRVQQDDHWYAFTQFQAIAARHCFVSFDEPVCKATFAVSLTVQREHTALANTPQIGEVELPNGTKRVQFATTKKILNYLVAMAVGPLDVVEAEPIPPNSVRKVPLQLRGIAARGQGHRLTYALKHTGRVLQILEEYVGVPYPFRKLDIVAVPRFGGGAMENVGLITFRDLVLMVEQETIMEVSTRGCPDWILPNADGAGYYRWSLPPKYLRRLKKTSNDRLPTRELLSVGDSSWAGFARGTVSAAAALELAPWFTRHPEREVATIPMRFVRFTRDRLVEEGQRKRVERFARDLFRGPPCGKCEVAGGIVLSGPRKESRNGL